MTNMQTGGFRIGQIICFQSINHHAARKCNTFLLMARPLISQKEQGLALSTHI